MYLVIRFCSVFVLPTNLFETVAAHALPFQGLGHDSEVAVAEPEIDDLLPFVGQAGQRPEALSAGRLQGEVHVLEREGQRELCGKVTVRNAVELGCLPGGHERSSV